MKTIKDTDYGDLTGQTYNGNIDVDDKELTSLKGSPKKVMGRFYCNSNNLTTLEFAPQEVYGAFECFRNMLTTLKGGPTMVTGDYSCSSNELTSLEGSPQTVGGDFNVSDNKLKTLKGAPSKIEGVFRCVNNPNLKNVKDEIINNNIRAMRYNTDEGTFTYDDFKEDFKRIDTNKRVSRPSMRKLLGLDK